jgi:hypothetical protein
MDSGSWFRFARHSRALNSASRLNSHPEWDMSKIDDERAIAIQIETYRQGFLHLSPERIASIWDAHHVPMIYVAQEMREPTYGWDAIRRYFAALRDHLEKVLLKALSDVRIDVLGDTAIAVLKNALDYLWAEWGRKPAAFMSFGNVGGARAIEQLRGIAVEVRMAPLGEAVHIFSAGEKVAEGRFAADSRDEKQITRLFDSLAWWAAALAAARSRRLEVHEVRDHSGRRAVVAHPCAE